jgi:hypothetical protein
MLLETIFGGALGAISRLLPEVIKFFDRKDERKHELAMSNLQIEVAKIQGQFTVEQKYVDFGIEQLSAMQASYKEQESALSKGSKWLANLSGSVRPGIAWALFLMYFIFKISMLVSGIATGQPWLVVLGAYTEADHALLSSILAYYYVNRSIQQYQK